MSTAPQTYESTLIPGGARPAGTVTDAAGAAIAGANVKAFDANSAVVGQTGTDAAGSYEIRALPEGAIHLEVASQGFSSATVSGIIASASRSTRQDVRLQVGSVTQSVEVTASAPSVASAGGRSLGSGAALGGRGDRVTAPVTDRALAAEWGAG
jgi:hypothetical protein